MGLFHISSGKLNGEAEADTWEDAFLKLLEIKLPESLSDIVAIRHLDAPTHDEKLTRWALVQPVLQENNLWFNPDAETPRPRKIRKDKRQC